MIDAEYYVYGLLDPFTKLPFYVGKGKDRRVYRHLLNNKKSENRFKDAKIKGIRNKGSEPEVYYYAKNLTEVEAYNFEKLIIQTYGRIRLDEDGILTNRCEDNRPPRYTAAQRREVMGEEKYLLMCQKQSERQKGIPKNYKPFGGKHIKFGVDNGFYGKTHSDEFKLKNSIAKKGNTNRKGVPFTEEAKLKIQLNNPNRKDIVTPHGEFLSCEEFEKKTKLANAITIRNMMKQPDKILTKYQFLKSKLFKETDIGKTYKNIGWYFK